MAAYEALWIRDGATFKRIADKFRQHPDFLPSDFVSEKELETAKSFLNEAVLSQPNGLNLGIRINGSFEYPQKLRDAKNPIEVFYFCGNWDLVFSKAIAIVGARKVSEDGVRRTKKLAKMLVAEGYTVVSGLAEGVDTAAHTAAIESGGNTIAVIGTPLNHIYPRKNKDLQDLISKEHLLISQVPFLKYKQQDYRANRNFFPERNVTMSALTEATIIVEASDTSGTLYQARAALAQGRKLFILESCFNNKKITWPERFEKKGAHRVKTFEDIKRALKI
ncbi:SMF protein [Alcanivorax jadensis T9]|uniref:SMF protein n=2 Tax=Alcanivorax jadensis TaxID=64988 RepID=A0ABR4WBE0_9GAMM|nr:SMF protein [Alcanivorax jadensis T9]